MPAKKTHLTDEERAKRIREAAEKAEASNDPEVFDRVFTGVVSKPASGGIPGLPSPKSRPRGKR